MKVRNKNAHVGSMSVTDHEKSTWGCKFNRDLLNVNINMKSASLLQHNINMLEIDKWLDPEPLANDSSMPTSYPINAFTGSLRHTIEAYH